MRLRSRTASVSPAGHRNYLHRNVDNTNSDLHIAIKQVGCFRGNSKLDNTTVIQHFALIESRSALFGWTEHTLFAVAKASLIGDALEFLLSIDEIHINSYDKLKTTIIKRFNEAPDPEFLRAQLDQCIQGNRPVMMFVEELRTLAAKIYSVTKNRVSDDTLFTIFKNGIKPEYKRVIRILGITEFTQAVAKIDNLESHDRLEGFAIGNGSHTFRDSLACTRTSETTPTDTATIIREVASIIRNEMRLDNRNGPVNRRARKPSVVCFRCQRPNHKRAQCYANTDINGVALPRTNDYIARNNGRYERQRGASSGQDHMPLQEPPVSNVNAMNVNGNRNHENM